jgi:hypothetical protein
MNWIFIAFLVASVFHMTEEYFIPGGFMDLMKRLNPRIAPQVTVPSAVIINGLQLVVCVLAIVFGDGSAAFGLSVAALLAFNGLTHLGACLRIRGYAPGVITGLVLYMPLSIYGYYLFMIDGKLSSKDFAISIALGLFYQLVPIGYFGITGAIKRSRPSWKEKV